MRGYMHTCIHTYIQKIYLKSSLIHVNRKLRASAAAAASAGAAAERAQLLLRLLQLLLLLLHTQLREPFNSHSQLHAFKRDRAYGQPY